MRALVRAAYARWVPVIGREPWPMIDDYAARIAAGQAWVLETEQGLEGALVLEDDDGALMLDNIAVATGSQGRGHGLALMGFAEEEARRRGYTRIRLYTNELMTTNIALYARHGYVETHRAEGSGFRRVFMEKPLA
jgi:ribosomal protein S18 acetylase RimI-like enzyme